MIRILFANKDQKLSQIYQRHMQGHFMVDSVYDGITALRRLKVGRPSLVVSDYHLPSLSGLSLLQFMRSSGHFSSTPFIFLSSHDDNSQALSLAANDWLDIRSTQPEILLERIYFHLKTNKHAIQIH